VRGASGFATSKAAVSFRPTACGSRNVQHRQRSAVCGHVKSPPPAAEISPRISPRGSSIVGCWSSRSKRLAGLARWPAGARPVLAGASERGFRPRQHLWRLRRCWTRTSCCASGRRVTGRIGARHGLLPPGRGPQPVSQGRTERESQCRWFADSGESSRPGNSGRKRTWFSQSEVVLHSTTSSKFSMTRPIGTHCGTMITPGVGMPFSMRPYAAAVMVDAS